jgi:hypothetical protein
MIAKVGLLSRDNTVDRENAYRLGAAAWYRYRKASNLEDSIWSRLKTITLNLPGFITSGFLKDSDLLPIDHIEAVGVWDTVGALGIPQYNSGQALDGFKFADTSLSAKVRNGFHAVALDEQRVVFTPTLWDSAPNITQDLFPGAHADVGGGYPSKNIESGLSDCAFKWMKDHLASVGVLFSDPPPFMIAPDPRGVAHKPWLDSPWNLAVFPTGPRVFPKGFPQNAAIAARMSAPRVIDNPGNTPRPYRPSNLPQP